MPPKVCGVVRAQESIRAGEGDGSWAIAPPKPSISPMAFAESNLRLFPWFLNRWSCLDRLDDSCHRKYRARERLVEVRGWWRIDRGAGDGSTCQGDRRRGRWKRHQSRWRSGIRGSVYWRWSNAQDVLFSCWCFQIHEWEYSLQVLLERYVSLDRWL